jgi:hypothetical protein
MKFLTIKRADINRDLWDAFVDVSDEAWLYHRFDLQDTIATWPGKIDTSFAITDSGAEGNILALMPLHRLEDPDGKVFSLNSLGGPAFANNLGKNQKRKVMNHLQNHILSLASKYDVQFIDVALSPMAPAYRGERCPRVNPLLHLGYENTLTQSYVIDLRLSEEEIWEKIHSYCRTHIRKAEKEGCAVREASTFSDIETYYDIHCETYHRTGVPPHPFEYFKAIWENCTTKGFSRIFLAENNGRIVAADNEAVYKNAMSGWTAAGRIEASKIGANNLLHWHAIRWARQNGCEWYESGEGFPNFKEGKEKGLSDFKKSFGGELYPFYRGRITIEKKQNPYEEIWRHFSKILHNIRIIMKI